MRVNAPLPALATGAIRVILRTSTNLQVCENTFDYIDQAVRPITPALLQGVAIAFQVVTAVNLPAILSPQTTLVDLLAISLTDISVPTQTVPYAPATVGTVVGATLPLEMGVILRKGVGIRGQHGIGRVTMPAVPVSFTTPAVDPNVLNAAGILAYTNFIGSAATALFVGGAFVTPALTTRPTPPATNASRGAVLTTWVPVSLLGTARRRREGRGI